MRTAKVITLPQQARPVDYSDGYRDGLKDGEKWANTHFAWLGVAIGVILSGVIALATVGWIIR